MMRNDAALDFLRARRSRPAKLLRGPGPDIEALRELLQIAARCPDHGKLEPFRFIILQAAALRRLGEVVRRFGAARALAPEVIDKDAAAYEQSPIAVAVIFSPKASPKVPHVEQQHAAACACYGLLTAALAAGWGANWLTGWPMHTRDVIEAHLGLTADEAVVGMVHIGQTDTTPPERPRPDLDAITSLMAD